MKKAALGLVIILCGCPGNDLRGRTSGIRDVIRQARDNGAYKCAPRELAMAESHLDFANADLDLGKYFPAKHQVAIAEENAHRALELSPKERCNPPPPPPKPLDTDGDGIPDKTDKCPTVPEDKDGFQDEDGCPDPDNDKDGIPDASDKCPGQPETLNGIKDDDGCPDPGPEVVRLGQGRIEVDEKIGFASKGGAIIVRDASAKYVNDVALVLKGHPEITKLRIDVKADGVPKSETQRRADALRDFLVSKGVDAGRLEAVGAGAGGSHVDFVVVTTAPETPAGGAGAKPAAPAPAANRPPGAAPPSTP
jgi:hypothetical protein